MEKSIITGEMQAAAVEALKCLTRNEANFLRVRLGFADGLVHTLDEAADILNRRDDKLFENWQKICRKLKNPTRKKQRDALHPFFERAGLTLL